MPVLIGGKPPKKNVPQWVVYAIGFGVFGLFWIVLRVTGNSSQTPQTVQPPINSPSVVASSPSPPVGDKTAHGLAVTDSNEAYEQTYNALLDTVEPRCNESRETIGDMVYKSVQIARERGLRTSNLDMLNGLNTATEPLGEAKTSTKCSEILAAMILIMESKSK